MPRRYGADRTRLELPDRHAGAEIRRRRRAATARTRRGEARASVDHLYPHLTHRSRWFMLRVQYLGYRFDPRGNAARPRARCCASEVCRCCAGCPTSRRASRCRSRPKLLVAFLDHRERCWSPSAPRASIGLDGGQAARRGTGRLCSARSPRTARSSTTRRSQLYSVVARPCWCPTSARSRRRCASSISSATTSIGCSSCAQDEVELLGRVRHRLRGVHRRRHAGRRVAPRGQGWPRVARCRSAAPARWPSAWSA